MPDQARPSYESQASFIDSFTTDKEKWIGRGKREAVVEKHCQASREHQEITCDIFNRDPSLAINSISPSFWSRTLEGLFELTRRDQPGRVRSCTAEIHTVSFVALRAPRLEITC